MPILDYNEFLKAATQFLSSDMQGERITAGVIINFENFSELDSVLGFSSVDLLLEQAANRLVDSLRSTDIVGLLSRHQIACLLPNLISRNHAELAGHKIFRVFNTPFPQGKNQILVTVHLGIAITDQSHQDAAELFRQANSAMHQATHDRKNLKIYTPKIDELILSELELLADLDRAIAESRVFLAFQPQLSLENQKIVGAEALLRWTHPQLGSVPPHSMVHVAERTGLISKLTFWVFHAALRQCAEYRSVGLDISVSINLSAYNISEPDLVDIVSQALQLWKVPPQNVVIELTETAIMDEHKQSKLVFRQFKDMGIKIAMDDFGTGYSSLALLRKLPIDEIKIDLSFIQNMIRKPEHEYIVDSIISLAHKLNIRVIAEGVENIETYQCLKKLNCDLIQGFLISPPLLLADFIKFVSKFNNSSKSRAKILPLE